MQNNNLVTEVSMPVIAGLLIIAATTLLYVGKVDFTGATLLFGMAVGVFGVQGAFKAPSPNQQSQINTQQQNLQQLLSQVMDVLPTVLQHTHPSVQAPVVPQVPLNPPAPVAMPSSTPSEAISKQPGS